MSESDQGKGYVRHFEWLDALRSLAAMIVVLTHAWAFIFPEYALLGPDSRGPMVWAFYASTRLGHEAVIVFFVLSGYLVGGKAAQRIANGSFRPQEYAIDRISRIWVPLVPALALSGLAAGNIEGAASWAGNLAGLQGVVVDPLGGNGPLWSLAYEVWFYALAYAIGRQCMRKEIDFIALALVVIVTLVFTVLKVHYLICWLIGALFYVRPHRLRAKTALALAALLCAIAVAGLQLSSDGIMSVVSEPGVVRPALELLLATGAGIACVTLTELRPSKASRFAALLAASSYTLYLTHYPLLKLAQRAAPFENVRNANAAAFAAYILTVSLLLLIAWAIYWLFESRTHLVRRWMRQVLSSSLRLQN